MTSIGRALMTNPSLLILDEPSTGLTPIAVKRVFDALLTIVQTGLTVLIVEQNVEEALAFSHYGYVLSNGEIALEGPRPSYLPIRGSLTAIYSAIDDLGIFHPV